MSKPIVSPQAGSPTSPWKKAVEDLPLPKSMDELIDDLEPGDLDGWSRKEYSRIHEQRRRIDEDLSGLWAKAMAGEEFAIATLHYLAHKATVMLNKFSRARPSLIRPLAQRQEVWPALMGRYAPVRKATERLLQHIELGEDPDCFEPEKLFKSFSTARAMAVRSISWVEGLRNSGRWQQGRQAAMAEHGVQVQSQLGPFEVKCARLPEFSEETIKEWYPLCRQFIMKLCDDHPERVKSLRSIGISKAGKDPKYRESRIRAGIFERIKDAMREVARGSRARASKNTSPQRKKKGAAPSGGAAART
jgi:hypothetical protein